MRFPNPPSWLPCHVRTATFHVEPRDDAAQPGVGEILSRIASEYGSPRSEPGDDLHMVLGASQAYVRATEEEGYQTFLFALTPTKDEGRSSSLREERTPHDDQLDELMGLLPKDPVSLFDLRLAWDAGQARAEGLLEQYLRLIPRPATSMGIVRRCLLAGLESEQAAATSRTLRGEFVLLPFHDDRRQATRVAWDLCGEMAALASHAGRLNHLRSRHTLVLEQIDASEQSTQMRINEILAGLRLPLEQIQPGDLEGTLTEVTTLFSRLSILAGAMRRDHVKAQALLRDVRRLFMRWNEQDLHSYPTNSSFQTDACETLIAPFKDYIERVEAVRGQLNTVLEAVRTYLDIQAQRTSLDEQKSSKEQLIRLVNLQEILHKLEILIVAFYLTEMARIVFEALAHERAMFLTVGFIPVALGLAVLIARLLHRGV